MTVQQYKQQLYDACKEHSFFAQQALDRYDAATTDQEREQARIDNIQHLAAYHALQWALDKAIDGEQQYYGGKLPKTLGMHYVDEVVDYALKKEQDDYDKKVKIDVLNKVKSLAVYDDNYLDGYVFVDDIDKLIDEVQNET